ncbi:MAG TPA: AAA family ATPase, partial [Acidimicrobiales bacterium]|nr:AAA family ATPase [Acidimicrobiales bacterium]
MNVLAREGEYWTAVFGGRVSHVRDAKGLHYLAHLLRHPGEEFHALALIAAVDAPAPAPPGEVDRADGLSASRPGDAGPVLDAAAVAAYRQRFHALQEELADAEERGDVLALERAQNELDALTEQLAGGLGLGGRHRRAGSAAERARLAVTKAIRSSLTRLEQADPDLGRHLRRTVRTGTFCTYAPDPALAVVWRESVDPAPSSPPRPVPRRPARSAFVGRPLERRLISELVAAAAGGRGGLLLVSGEAGIGKTRLAEEGMAQAEERGMATFVGRCLDAQPALAWLPFVEVLEQLAGDLDDVALRHLLGGAGPEVAKVLPSLRRRLPELPAPIDLPAEQGRQFLYATLRDLLLRLGSARPALVVLEDVHWADPATLNMLEHLVDGLEDAKVLVVATYRSDEAALGTPLARALERLLRHPACARLALGRLDHDEVAELVASVTGRTPPPSLAARLADEADGNPFFVTELLKHLAAEAHLYAEDGAFRADLAERPPPVPESLKLLLGHRLHRLSPGCRLVLDLAAVLGRDVDVDLLGEQALDAVEEALVAGVLVASEDDRVRFSHALLRQAALEQVSPVRRRRLHLEVAEALRRRYGADPEHAGEIADHLERAGTAPDPATTLRFLELAGRRSLESAAYEDAADRFRRALALASDPRARARLLAGLGYAQRGLGLPGDANASWLEALDLLEGDPGDDAVLAAELSRALGRYLDATGGLDQAIAVLERGLRAASTGVMPERSSLLSALGYAHTLAGDTVRAAACIDEASAIAEALDDDRLRADVLATRTSMEFATGRLRECIVTADDAERELLACGQPWDALQAKVTTLWPRMWLGHLDDARRSVDEALPLAHRLGHVAGVFLARRSTAILDFLSTGDLERFAGQAVEGLEFCRTHRLRWVADAHVLAGLAHFWGGDWDRAAHHLRAGAAAPAPPIYAGRYSATLLTFYAWSGDVEAFDVLDA